MKNQGTVVFLTIIVTLLCLYYLSFTFVSNSVQSDAIEYASDAGGNVDFAKKQSFLDSVWNEPVYNLLGIEYSYKDIKETELGLGLDLQGGMHVTLEVSPVDIIKGLSGNNDDPQFLEALKLASELQRNSQEDYVDLFLQAYSEVSDGGKLAAIFANAANRDKNISFQSSNDDIINLIKDEVRQAIDRSFNILRTRVDRFGTSQPNIQQLPGTGRIQIELPGVENRERVRKLLQGVAKLEFWEVINFYDQELAGPLAAVNNKLVDEERLNAAKLTDGGTGTGNTQTAQEDLSTLLGAEEDSASTDLAEGAKSDSTALDSLTNTQISEFFTMIRYPQGLVNLKDTTKINRILARLQNGDLKGLIPPTIRFLWDVHAITLEDGSGEEVLPLYAIRVGRGGKALLTGEVVTDARQSYDERTAPAVSMSMNGVGARAWKRITAESIGKRIAIALDDYVQSAPTVNSEIPNGQSIITGNFTLEEAQDLANVLKAGALPARTRIVEEAVIGPTLGKEAQGQGVMSIVTGLMIVVVFMVVYYSKGGLVANVALLFNIFFILGILAQLNAALTLPGIAGIVLTIGMSIDANVLIFERIREEIRNGTSLLSAISTGYGKAYSSIIDANVTTFITGIILFMLGQGPVKGFATTLMIGIACSFFSAVFITRVLITWMTKKGDKSKVSFATPFSNNLLSNLNIDFLSRRRFAYIGSISFITVGLTLIFLQGGMNFGVDFTGGRSYVVAFNSPVVASELKVALTDDFQDAGTEVKTYGSNNVVKVTTSYLVTDESSEADQAVEKALIAGLEKATGQTYIEDDTKVDDRHFSISGSSKVGATIADDIKSASLESIIFSLIAIFLYILIRFKKWQFSLGAIFALFHDVLVVISAFAFARLFGKAFEVDQVFIAAMLTIIGYSINDTVVVFDRIRENLAIRPHEKTIDTFNLSINNTMNRTLITSFTTLVVVFILLVFGGEVLRGFSFALFIGILVGTYSSVFIATPSVIDLGKSKYGPKGDS
ncbi:MAG: protein translocase subunit SecDF [Cytophagales bacterium]|nr:protein translocase subunit SecDF [Cytophagales bacterium]